MPPLTPAARRWPRLLTAGLLRNAGKDIVLVLAGNKVDLERSRQVPLSEAEAYAASIGAVLCSTSAKMNKGVDQAFQAIADSALPPFWCGSPSDGAN